MKDVTPYANSIFEQPWWLDVVAPGQWGEVFAKENNEIVGRMAYVIRNKKIIMPKSTQTLGIWIAPQYREFKNGNAQLGKQKEIIYDLFEQLPHHKSLTMTLDSSNDYILPFRWQGCRYEPTFSYRIKDLSNINDVYGRFSKSVKKNIRRDSETSIISNENDIEVLYNIMEKTFEAQGRKYPDKKEFIFKLVESCIEHDSGHMFIARDKSKNVQAVSYLVYDKNIAYALLGGSDPEFRGIGSKSVVFWNEIQYAATVSKSFDFEGSNIEGIENFVRQFGGEKVVNYMIKKQTILRDFIDVSKPKIKKLIGYRI